MTRNNTIKSFSLATGAALVLGAFGGTAMAEQANPFAMTELSQGYSVATAADGKCGTAKCGGMEKKADAKAADGKCGGMEKKTDAKAADDKVSMKLFKNKSRYTAMRSGATPAMVMCFLGWRIASAKASCCWRNVAVSGRTLCIHRLRCRLVTSYCVNFLQQLCQRR